MKDSKFVVGDIHGMHSMLDTLLKEWQVDSEQLVFLGDYIDRGKESKKVVERVMSLKENYGAITLKGNHEDMFLQWIEVPEELASFYLSQGGYETLRSFGIDSQLRYDEQARVFKDTYPDFLEFLEELDSYYEDETHIYVHAGINPNEKEMKDMNPIDLLWIRDLFFYREHQMKKRIIFGHTPTCFIRLDQKNEIWLSEDNSKVGIDGGAVAGGNLIALRIRPNGYDSLALNQQLLLEVKRLEIEK